MDWLESVLHMRLPVMKVGVLCDVRHAIASDLRPEQLATCSNNDHECSACCFVAGYQEIALSPLSSLPTACATLPGGRGRGASISTSRLTRKHARRRGAPASACLRSIASAADARLLVAQESLRARMGDVSFRRIPRL
ncbi:hypothetical protein AB1Y20_017814 [Prymnesium parvum]|uniref:Uncharacterized protein n=1 Tax=Prymnesium parvum TaxID=97485 RepID=A0AB34JQ22_PRYPA